MPDHLGAWMDARFLTHSARKPTGAVQHYRRRCLLAACLLAILLAGCTSPETGRRASGREIEVQIFMGGYGLDFFEKLARTYEQAHPGVKVTLSGDPRIIDKIRPRLLAGNPPDVFWAFLPMWRLANGGALYELSADLATPAYGQQITWRQSFLDGPLSTAMIGDKIYFVPTDLSVMLMWYNVKMFRQHGWRVPRTLDEMLDLCERIKAAGIAPIAFQGRYPDYATPLLLSLFQRKAGGRPLYDVINMKKGAWMHPDLVWAAGVLQEMVNKGYFQPGCMGMTHTEAQMEFVNGRAAMVPCGTWLKAEQAGTTPKGFEMSCFNYPAVTGGKGDPSVACISMGYWCVPAQAVNRKGGVDFLKWVTSRANANEFAREKYTLFSIKDADKDLCRELAPAVATMKQARYTWAAMMSNWYPELSRRLNDSLSSLMAGNMTPEEFCRRMEAQAERTRRDRSVPKYTLPLPAGVEP